MGIKSAKTLLKKILGGRILTFEEMSTLITRIEMTLNCRPLTALSGHTDDLEVLTPEHLVREAPLNQIPALCPDTKRLDALQHWDLVRAMYARFWSQWSRQYLNTLQQRLKWTRGQSNLQSGDIVLILDSALLIDATVDGPLGECCALSTARTTWCDRTKSGHQLGPTRV